MPSTQAMTPPPPSLPAQAMTQPCPVVYESPTSGKPVKKRTNLMPAFALLSLVLGMTTGGVIYYVVRVLPLS
ncbi:MAG: hypothetical protein LBM60_00770 [Clostridium sp.]|nr:hypothetical protein [Clostridium sp.]